MKKLILSALSLFLVGVVFSQNVGIGTNTPNASAALDITDSTKGILIPRMTLSQRNAIQNPAEGLMVYQTDSTKGYWGFVNDNWVYLNMLAGTAIGQMQYWNGVSWVQISPGGYGQYLAICDGIPAWGGCLPKVTSSAISSIAYTTASGGGNVTADGGSAVTSRGICWSTSPNPNVSLNTKTTNGSGIGSFSSSITGLTSGTLYYVRAYATNSVGTAYGAQQNFTTNTLTVPVVATTVPSSISFTTATSGGNITSDGGAPVSVRGICWSTSPEPTVVVSTKTVDGTGIGGFTSNMTGLNPSTTYYVRAYATNSVGTAYGVQQTFITNSLSIPTVTTNIINSITSTSAQCGGNIVGDGGAAVSFRGVCWSTSVNPTISLSTKTLDGAGTGTFTSIISGLIPNTTYYVRAYATNSVGTAYGNQQSFTTVALGSISALNCISATNEGIITAGTAVNGVISSVPYTGGNGGLYNGQSVSSTGVTGLTATLSAGSFASGAGTLTYIITGTPASSGIANFALSIGGQSCTLARTVNAVLSSVTIGTQIWSDKNLDVARYRNGDPIPQVTNPTEWGNLTTGAWCWYNNDSIAYGALYGRIYNWYAINDPRGLAPQGWHIPNEYDWNKLVKYLDAVADTTCANCTQSTTAGGSMKSTTSLWASPNAGATNSSGFSGFPGGYLVTGAGGSTISAGTYGVWWSASENDNVYVWSRQLRNNSSSVGKFFWDKRNGLYVRVVKD